MDLSTFKSYLKYHFEAVGKMLKCQEVHRSIEEIAQALIKASLNDKTIFICGNGGSAADAQHIEGELVGKFFHTRRPIKAQALTTNTSVLTAWSNDVDFESVYARQIEAFGKPGDYLIAISTSGESKNIIRAVQVAKRLGIGTAVLTGENKCTLDQLGDQVLRAPSILTPVTQEMHIIMYHYLCAKIEEAYLNDT